MDLTLEQAAGYFQESFFQIGYLPVEEWQQIKDQLIERYSSLCELWQNAVRDEYEIRLTEVDKLLAGKF